MIKQEFYKVREDGVDLYRTYSDRHVYIRCNETGNIYSEAVNVQNSGHTYTETNDPIETDEENYREAAEILLGIEGEN